MEQHEVAWAEALADEHAHQRELLVTLRDELGTFARECASALTALDAFVGLAGIAGILNAARTDVQQAALVLEVGKRFARSPGDDETEKLYSALGEERDVSLPLVRHAAELVRSPQRSDRELMQAVVTASGARAQLEAIIGPAPVAALTALKPLARWAPMLGRGQGRELLGSAAKDLSQVLEGAAQLGAGTDTAAGGDAAALADSLRDTAAHVEWAIHTVRNGKLAEILAEARKTLEADLGKLRRIHEGAQSAPPEWREARRVEHAELTKEVHEKLDKVERTRRVLGLLLPHLQVVARALTALQKVQALVNRLEPPAAAGVEAARLSLTVALAELWQAAFGRSATPRPRPRTIRKRWIAAAAAAILAVVLGVVLSSGGKSRPAAAPAISVVVKTTPSTSVPAAPKLSPVNATFVEAQRATYYVINVTDPAESATYAWSLQTPPGNPTCNNFHRLSSQPNEAVWHHANTDGCTHNGIQHLGTVYVTVTTAHYRCTASFFGTLTHTGPPNQQCVRR